MPGPLYTLEDPELPPEVIKRVITDVVLSQVSFAMVEIYWEDCLC